MSPTAQDQPTRPDGRLRVAVLGGGMGALAAAVALTDPRRPGADRLALTVYQLGWRLGGKGASGRSLDPATHGRIEEHGLHNLFGFYDHTFRLMRGAYDELRLRHGIDRGDFMDAVAPESAAVFIEDVGGQPRPWHIHNPTNTRVPGDDGELTLAEAVRLALDFLRLNAAHHDRPLAAPPAPDSLPARAALRAVTAGLRALLRLVPEDMSDRPWWDQLAWLGERIPVELAVGALALARRGAWLALRRSLAADGPRRLWILLHFATSVLIGLFCDRVFARGLESINHLDFRAWLRPHMLEDGELLARSVLLRVVYDSSFAYRGGDTRSDHAGAPAADYEAGTLLAGLLRAAFTYKGAFGWKLQGGTGDVLIAPLYQLLRARGVEFRFFHRVDELIPAADGRSITGITLTQQAHTHGDDDYAPLVDFAGQPCWPNRPLWDQLADGPALAAARLDLEDPRVTPPGARSVTLERGVDFDAVVLGISAGALPTVAARLIAQNPRWRTATLRVATTRTQALQVWLRDGAAAPGHGRGAGQPITGFWYDAASPLNVWADMSHLIAHEGWAGGESPAHLSYYVSPLADDPEDEHAALASVHLHAHAVLAGPGAAKLRSPQARPFAWRDLLDRRPDASDGPARLGAQYLRANTHPSERYVLSVAGSTVHRLPPHDPGDYQNLFLAGDWTHNGMNCGAMESAVLGGLLAARAFPA
jgi:uncharacterized protein with NAD-binding domain and iron-sulfur cluster